MAPEIFIRLWPMALASVLVGLLSTVLIMRAGIGDIPDHRSSHAKVTPTGGGLVILIVIAVMFLILSQIYPNLVAEKRWPQLLSLLWMVGFLGLMDDIYTISTPLKFAVILVVCALAVWVIGPVTVLPYAVGNINLPYSLGFAGSVLWIFVVMNAVNFMDGANGLMGTVMGVALAGLVLICLLLGVPQIMWLSFACLIGVIAFLPFNIGHKARLFSGDVGALTLGFAFSVTVLWLCQARADLTLAFIGPVLILPFLVDVLLTLARRVGRKENLLKPHRSHLYQRFITSGRSHLCVAFAYGIVSIVLAVFCYFNVAFGTQKFLSFLIMPTAILLSTYLIISRRLKLKGL